MKDVRVDSDGEFRCWNCGNKGLLGKRTGRAHIAGYLTVGVGALATKKKLKCQTCGEYNDTGSAKPYDGPASRKWRKEWEKIERAKSAAQREADERAAQAAVAALTRAQVVDTASAPPPPPPLPPVEKSVPADWLADPTGRHELRYWDGSRWTEHVSDAGVTGQDPVDAPS
jgi:Protein of unknown function (DUF2510)